MSEMGAVLELLKKNARMSVEEMAVGLNISEMAVSEAIAQLEKEGIVLGYRAVVDETKVSKETTCVRGLIEVRVRPEKGVGFSEVASRIYQFSNVVDHYLVSGNYDFMLVVEGQSIQEISSFVSQKLATIEHVVSTRTHFIMDRYKEKGVVFKKRNDDRLKMVL